jgi:hypothetical protein
MFLRNRNGQKKVAVHEKGMVRRRDHVSEKKEWLERRTLILRKRNSQKEGKSF